jgi:hypothetical protein
MAANTQPIFSIQGEAQWSTLMNAANTGNVTGSTSYLVFTAGTNGSFVQKIRFRHVPPSGNTAATVARVWINNGNDVTVASNSTLFDEITIASNTTFSQVASTPFYEIPLNFAIPTNYRIYVTLGTSPTTGANIQATVIGGDY